MGRYKGRKFKKKENPPKELQLGFTNSGTIVPFNHPEVVFTIKLTKLVKWEQHSVRGVVLHTVELQYEETKASIEKRTKK